MKKLLLVLGIITCMLGVSACGNKKVQEPEVNPAGITEEGAIEYAAGFIESLNGIVVSGLQAQYATEPVLKNALDNWTLALTEIGQFQSITGFEVEIGAEEVVIRADIEGTERNAVTEIILDGTGTLQSISTNAIYSFGETMEKAALNTLLGMGTVFSVLILISLIISSFTLISKVQSKPAAKAEKAEKPAEAAPVAAAVEEDLADDCELVAVIAAAIAASEGASSTDGFVVRSIKRRSSKWQKA